LAGDVQLVFGENILEYVMRLIQGQIDYLPRLPKQIVMHIIQFLELSDIAALARVSKQFRRVMSSFPLYTMCGKKVPAFKLLSRSCLIFQSVLIVF